MERRYFYPLEALASLELRGRPAWTRAVCSRCDSLHLTNLYDPNARSAYFNHLERQAT